VIVAFDPGVTTGVATAELVDGEFVFDSFQLGEIEFYEWVDLHCSDFDHFQVERFIITQASAKKDVVYDSLYLIGYLRYVAWRCGVPTSYTKPADVMAPFPDDALKRANLHKPGKVHANDAMRHLAYHLVVTKQIPGAQFLSKDDDDTT
jgi:hypothetical protein